VEDLGDITPDVHALRDELGLPGMKILQFAFDGDPGHPFKPHNWTHPRWVAYTGTHDNNTSRGWYEDSDPLTQHRCRVYVSRSGEEPQWDLIRLAWSSIAQTAITQLQDLLGLGSEGRFNVPGTATGNWVWRTPTLPDRFASHRLRETTERFGRRKPEAP
jgi:4-alpha-glucanotransferase